MKRWVKWTAVGVLGTAGVLAAEAATAFHLGIRRASDRQAKRLTELIDTDPEIITEIEEGISWLEEQEVQEVSITGYDGLKLKGHYLASPGARRTVIAFHGYKSRAYHDFGAEARFYYEHGCNLLLAEQRGHRVSEGEYVDLGILARHDVISWTRYINTVNGSSLPVFLLGISMGAATVTMASDLPLPSNVRGIIDDCGYSDTWEEASFFGKRYHSFPNTLLMPLFDLLCRLRAGFSLRDASPRRSLAKTRIPILMFHGTDDTIVPIRSSYENYSSCHAPKRLIQVEGAEHGESYFRARALYEEEVLAFFERCGA